MTRTLIRAARREGWQSLAATAWLADRQGRHAFAESVRALMRAAFCGGAP